MRLTRDEQKICEKYSAYRPSEITIGDEVIKVERVACDKCPLVIDRKACLCKKRYFRGFERV